MATLLSTLTAKPGQGAALEQLLREMVRRTAGEPGAFCYDLLRPEDRPDTLLVYERYRDEEAKTAHLGSSYLAAMLERARRHDRRNGAAKSDQHRHKAAPG